jgi:hypothetical protein
MVLSLQRITANISGKIRHDRMGGKDYLVVPMIMMCEGVHAGTNGPLYYPAEEMARNAEVWNHKPCVIYHPTQNGQAMSACQPDVITSRGVGVVMNNRFDDGKWKAEAWLEEERLKVVDNRVLEMLEQDKMCEVSTGLYTENEKKDGEWNGEAYHAVARNYGPDHLAILPDQTGACSIADGAGLLRLNHAVDNRMFSAKERRGMDLADFGDPAARAYPVRDQHDLENAARLIGHANDPAAVKARLLAIAKRKGLKPPAAWADKTHNLAINAMAHGDLHDALHSKVRVMMGENCYGAHVVDVYPDAFVYTDGNDLYRAGYKEANGDVKITGDPELVKRHIEYRTPEGAYVGNAAGSQTQEPSTMDKKVIVDKILAANTGWAETDREFLMGLTPERLALVGKPTANKEPEKKTDPPAAPAPTAPAANVAPAAPAAPAAPVVNKGDVLKALQALTADEYIANAPVGIRGMLLDGMAQANNERTTLIAEITGNAANSFTAEQLAAKETPELRSLAKLARGMGGGSDLYSSYRPNYAGAAAAPPVGNAAEPLAGPGLPTMNFDTKK